MRYLHCQHQQLFQRSSAPAGHGAQQPVLIQRVIHCVHKALSNRLIRHGTPNMFAVQCIKPVLDALQIRAFVSPRGFESGTRPREAALHSQHRIRGR